MLNLSSHLHLFKFIRARKNTMSLFIIETLKYVEDNSSRHSVSTHRNYIAAVHSLQRFAQDMHCVHRNMDAETIRQYEQWLHEHGICRNTSSCYLRSLRSLYNQQHTDNTDSIFAKVFTGNARTEKRALPANFIRQLRQNAPSLLSPLRLWYDVFMFSLMAYGMPFVDVAHLRRDDIYDGMIHYRRHKTGQLITVPLTEEMAEIIAYYTSHDASETKRQHLHDPSLVFPILPNAACSYDAYSHQLSLYNKALKLLTQRCGLSRHITSYVARHTWASLASESGVNLQQISQAMGHTSIRTTQIYLSQLPSSSMQAVSNAVSRLLK